MGASVHVCDGCLRLLATTESRGREIQSRLDALLGNLEGSLGPLRVQRDECLLHCGEGTICVLLRKDGEFRSKVAHLDPSNPQEPRWSRR